MILQNQVKDFDRFRDECGLFGILNHSNAAFKAYLGLYALQHRGEESAGIVSSDGSQMHIHKGMGLVGDVFDASVFDRLPGRHAMGHVRYSTTGSSSLKNAQPLMVEYSRGQIAIAHNGNLTNGQYLHDELQARGAIFQTTSDTEIVIHLLAAQRGAASEREALINTLQMLRGAFSMLIMKPDMLIAIRDPQGFRPLCLGKSDGSYIVASETCALDLLNAEFIREIEPGEVLFITETGLESVFPFARNQKRAMCIFELIYFARPDSVIFGENVHLIRQKMGRRLAVEHPAKADMVISIPDSGNSAALGYAHQSGIPFDIGITRNHYIGRTFLQPKQAIRDFGVKVKLNPIPEVIRGKRIVVVEDSIVRGTTTMQRMANLVNAGAKEVHLRIACPPHISPCYYGIDFPSKKELIAANKTVEEIRRYLGITSLGYLSLEGMLGCTGDGKNYCTACFTGNYPTPIEHIEDKYISIADRLQEQIKFD
jgi:amidophosphoribosyltransferase